MTNKKDTIADEVTSVENDIIEKQKKTSAKTIRKYASDDLIPCRSVTYGELLLSAPKSKLMYVWANYNDVTEVEFQDLQALKSIRSSYLFRPRIVIEDDELVEQWGKDFKDMYSKIVNVDVEDMFNLPLGKFKTALKNAPNGVQQAVKNIAGEKILDGSLDSLAKIKAIDEILGTDLKLYLS